MICSLSVIQWWFGALLQTDLKIISPGGQLESAFAFVLDGFRLRAVMKRNAMELVLCRLLSVGAQPAGSVRRNAQVPCSYSTQSAMHSRS
jgi:hypothetical protein